MKKCILFLAALFLALAAAPVFADHIQPVEPKEITNEEARQEFDQGIREFMNDNFSEAAIHFYAAEEADPTIPEVHVNLAMALAGSGETEDAEKHFNEASNLIAQADVSPLPQG